MVGLLVPGMPGLIQLHKLNVMAKNKSEHIRNLTVFENAVKKLNLPFTVPNLEMLSNGKFQYNMECI